MLPGLTEIDYGRWEGLSPAQEKRLENTPGIKPGELLPVAITAAMVSGENIDVKGANMIPQAAMFFGVDPDRALRMIELEFRDENGNTYGHDDQLRMNHLASTELKLGHHLIHHAFDISPFGDVGLHRKAPPAGLRDCSHRLQGAAHIEIHYGNICPRLCKNFGDCPSDALGRAGHNRNFSFKFHHRPQETCELGSERLNGR